jgi:hypothetical protein
MAGKLTKKQQVDPLVFYLHHRVHRIQDLMGQYLQSSSIWLDEFIS